MPAVSIAVVGAGLAGLRACEGLRERGFEGRITLLGEEAHAPYDRPPLSKQFLAGEWDLDRVVLAAPDRLASLELELRLGPSHRAIQLDLAARRLSLASGESVSFDGLVLATGSAARRLPGISGLPGTYVLRTLDDAVALRNVLARPGARLVLASGRR
jgi:3-phenylpropionate/trans-cinnamate dioxygenase ferredoxin reductase subunit